MGLQDRVGFDAIRERAYELWERHHRPDGCEMTFWLMAERLLEAERAAMSVAAPEPDESGPKGDGGSGASDAV
ncbi:hypothetical protein LKMONMHP_2558 [Methylobacterium organophilum]|uniref:DUF2934 domain-containing protein n=1 Tax=Methylobacterium organophilum TaxID=410 RepID=A0ABQ4TCB0_METOR|nr:hypothetical protein LKMONMHP_2558 [Methylobacterium organophilum]